MLYIVTAVHNRYKITEKYVSQLKRQDFCDFTLLLVDDGSTDGTDKMVLENLPNSKILYGDGNLWWGGALHKAYKWLKKNAAKDDFVMFSNDDIYFEDDFIGKGVSHLTEKEGILVTGNGYSGTTGEMLDGSLTINFRDDETQLLPPGTEGNLASTRALFMRVCDMLKTGGFHPHLLPHYGSDYEYAIRACRKGFRVMSYPDLSYKINDSATGIKWTGKTKLKTLFSKKCEYNPIYRLNFRLLSTPAKYLPRRMFLMIRRGSRKLFARSK